MSRTILVTGAAGFIGSHLCEHLLNLEFEVIGIDNFDPFYPKQIKERNLVSNMNHPNFVFIEGDAGNPRVLKKIKSRPDVIIHLAAKAGVQPSLQNPSAYIDNNILLTNNLLEWMRSKQISKLIFASSSSVYGNTDVIPFKEDQPVNTPFSPYAFTKRSCELMNYTYHVLYDMDILNLRFFTVYGERQRPDLAIYKFVQRIYAGNPIHIYGDGSSSRDYTYWKDIIQGIMAALYYISDSTKIFESINLGSHTPIKLSKLVQEISDAMNLTPHIVYEDFKQGDVQTTYADISKAQKILNYKPITPLKEGLANFVQWYRDFVSTENFHP